jgi:hypothetical protein
MEWDGHVAHMGEKHDAFSVLVRNPEGMRRLGRHKRTWDDNIKMHLKEIEWAILDWIYLAQQKNHCQVVVNTVINLQIP